MDRVEEVSFVLFQRPNSSGENSTVYIAAVELDPSGQGVFCFLLLSLTGRLTVDECFRFFKSTST